MKPRRRSVTQEARQLAARTAFAATRRLLDAVGRVISPSARPALPPPQAIGAIPARGEVLIRLLSGDEPRERDFLSLCDKGRPRPEGLSYIAYCGLSMYERPDQAVHHARRSPLSVAAVELEAGAGIHLAKTFGVGHYTVWGDPETLLALAKPVASSTMIHRQDSGNLRGA